MCYDSQLVNDLVTQIDSALRFAMSQLLHSLTPQVQPHLEVVRRSRTLRHFSNTAFRSRRSPEFWSKELRAA